MLTDLLHPRILRPIAERRIHDDLLHVLKARVPHPLDVQVADVERPAHLLARFVHRVRPAADGFGHALGALLRVVQPEVKVLHFHRAAGGEVLEALLVEGRPVGEGAGEVAAVDQVEGLPVLPG